MINTEINTNINLDNNILEVKNIKVYFETKSRSNIKYIKSVDDLSFNLKQGEVLGIVGESGCGKSTLGRAILQLINSNNSKISGSINYNNQDLTKLNHKQLLAIRKDLQIIFQDPLASLNPRMTVGDIIAEPLKTFYSNLNKQERLTKVLKIMDDVGLIPEHLNRYPHEFSGGQCQRIGIARALILKPKIIICDEPVSALDVSIQAQIINLLKKLQKKYDLSLIFIAHDLSVVKYISDRIMVMYLGKIVELSDSHNIYSDPRHPYTKALLSAMPVADPEFMRDKKNILLKGELPSPLSPPSGCRFHTRCPIAKSKCSNVEPKLENKALNVDNNQEHLSACYILD